MNKFICVGTIVKTPVSDLEYRVVTVDRKAGTAVLRNKRGFRSEFIRNLIVVSYAGVE